VSSEVRVDRGRLGAHAARQDGIDGTAFAVWAPHARAVSVVGDWNDWEGRRDPLVADPLTGVWEGFVPGPRDGARYKFAVQSPDGALLLKADPHATSFEAEEPRTAAILHDVGGHRWEDGGWLAGREQRANLARPVSVYEVHLGSWRRAADGSFLDYRELAGRLGDYVTDMGFTDVELLPVMEHPFYGSWGYQSTGYYAPTRRYGTPEDFMALVDHLHRRGIGVILDWVPAHFPDDPHGLACFDGAPLYEPADPRRRRHPEWGTLVFDYARPEVVDFLVASARCWLERYHADALRVDAVASMLYLDYGRQPGEWEANEHGGRENLSAIAFLRHLNDTVRAAAPGAITIAEEAAAWPGVTRPTGDGGLGFALKWNMGWAHDVLAYLAQPPEERRHHHDRLTFSVMYAWDEQWVLPLSHDEVAPGRGSLLGRMPGDPWQRFANLRLLYGFMWAHPGKKLLFMGSELGQAEAWNHEVSLPWQLLEDGPYHRGVQSLVRDLNRLYRGVPALWELDAVPAGFEWMDCSDREQSIVSFLRYARDPEDVVLCAFNFTPTPRPAYRIGVPRPGFYREILNTDGGAYAGSNLGNAGGVQSDPIPWHGRSHSVRLTLPPLGAVWLKPEGR
jgi:1,4-alpha-glucan branching enzyme